MYTLFKNNLTNFTAFEKLYFDGTKLTQHRLKYYQ